MEILEYRTKPEKVQAVRLTAENFDDAADWLRSHGLIVEDCSYSKRRIMRLSLDEAFVEAWADRHYVVRDPRGRFRVMSDEEFRASHVHVASGFPLGEGMHG